MDITNLPGARLEPRPGRRADVRQPRLLLQQCRAAVRDAGAAGLRGGLRLYRQAVPGRRFPKFWVGAFASYDNLSGATIANSPLVQDKNNFAAGIAVSWIFDESSTRVMVND